MNLIAEPRPIVREGEKAKMNCNPYKVTLPELKNKKKKGNERNFKSSFEVM